jgi:uncharacterized membrane-anchored protein
MRLLAAKAGSSAGDIVIIRVEANGERMVQIAHRYARRERKERGKRNWWWEK